MLHLCMYQDTTNEGNTGFSCFLVSLAGDMFLIHSEQVSDQAVESSTKMPIIICNFTVMFITMLHESDFLYEAISCLTTS